MFSVTNNWQFVMGPYLWKLPTFHHNFSSLQLYLSDKCKFFLNFFLIFQQKKHRFVLFLQITSTTKDRTGRMIRFISVHNAQCRQTVSHVSNFIFRIEKKMLPEMKFKMAAQHDHMVFHEKNVFSMWFYLFNAYFWRTIFFFFF